MNFLKIVSLLFLALIFVITAFQMFSYWLGMLHFPFVATLVTGVAHVAILSALGWAFFQLCKYKV